MENSKYYYIKSKTLAMTIQFISALPFMVFDDKDNPSIKTYAFENTEQLQEIISKVNKLRKQYR